MADFPSKVSTETSVPNSQASQQGGNSLQGLATEVTTLMDMAFIRSIPAILMMAEIFLGLLHWSLIASVSFALLPAYGWVMFVAVTLWICTTTLFVLILFGAHQKLTSVPWPLTIMLYYAVATILYLTAFLANAASVQPYYYFYVYGHFAAAAFFAALAAVAYGASAYFSYLEWRGDRSSAATSTVPT